MKPDKKLMNALRTAIDSVELPEHCDRGILLKFFTSKAYWLDLQKMFKNYFKGVEVFRGVKDFGINYKILGNAFDYYRSFYDLISFSWSEIMEELGIVFDDLKLEKPGDVLIYVLKKDAQRWNDPLANPENLYRATKALEVDDLKTAEKYLNRIEKPDKRLVSTESRIMNLVIDICDSSKKKVIKEKLIMHKTQVKKRNDLILSYLRKTF